MLKLLLQRKWCVKDCTIGELFIDGQYECYTLEDVVRPVEQKVAGQTAIPTGSYRVVVDWSPRFKKNMLHILDVPGFLGVRIHPGNAATDTDGCILVGQTIDLDNGTIGASRMAYEQLFRKLSGGDTMILDVKEI